LSKPGRFTKKSKTDVDDKGRQIELEVRTAYSDFIEARKSGVGSKRCRSRPMKPCVKRVGGAEAGTSTQLDGSDAETR